MGGRSSRMRSYDNPAFQQLRTQREQAMNESRNRIKSQKNEHLGNLSKQNNINIQKTELPFRFQRVASRKVRQDIGTPKMTSSQIISIVEQEQQREQEEQMAFEQRYRKLTDNAESDFADEPSEQSETNNSEEKSNSQNNYDSHHHHFNEMDQGDLHAYQQTAEDKEREMQEKLKRVGTKKSSKNQSSTKTKIFSSNNNSKGDVSVEDIMSQMEKERPTNTYVSTINKMADNIVRTNSLEGIVGKREVKHKLPGHFDVSNEPVEKPTSRESSSLSSSLPSAHQISRSIPGTVREEDLQHVFNAVRRGEDPKEILKGIYGMEDDQCEIILDFYNNYVVIEGADNNFYGLWTTPQQTSTSHTNSETKRQEQNNE